MRLGGRSGSGLGLSDTGSPKTSSQLLSGLSAVPGSAGDSGTLSLAGSSSEATLQSTTVGLLCLHHRSVSLGKMLSRLVYRAEFMLRGSMAVRGQNITTRLGSVLRCKAGPWHALRLGCQIDAALLPEIAYFMFSFPHRRRHRRWRHMATAVAKGIATWYHIVATVALPVSLA